MRSFFLALNGILPVGRYEWFPWLVDVCINRLEHLIMKKKKFFSFSVLRTSTLCPKIEHSTMIQNYHSDEKVSMPTRWWTKGQLATHNQDLSFNFNSIIEILGLKTHGLMQKFLEVAHGLNCATTSQGTFNSSSN